MSEKVLILGGTSDTERFINKHYLDDFVISVATEYGYKQFYRKFGQDKVVLIRFDEKRLEEFICQYKIKKIVDTTHPFAKEITDLAQKVARSLNIPYESFIRNNEVDVHYNRLICVNSLREAISYLEENNFSKILFTIGSKMIKHFSFVKENAYVRILPFEQSIKDVLASGFDYNQIIAIQGPFSKDFNKALIKEFEIDLLVTKVSGEAGGFVEKVEACKETNIHCLAIKDWGNK
ncbi:precorrin-6A reductase [Deferribacteraceae bacterium V6Fe1]|nr:precorrin-6A reductase [Deferribacteraceae bacterium V6Fe1]